MSDVRTKPTSKRNPPGDEAKSPGARLPVLPPEACLWRDVTPEAACGTTRAGTTGTRAHLARVQGRSPPGRAIRRATDATVPSHSRTRGRPSTLQTAQTLEVGGTIRRRPRPSERPPAGGRGPPLRGTGKGGHGHDAARSGPAEAGERRAGIGRGSALLRKRAGAGQRVRPRALTRPSAESPAPAPSAPRRSPPAPAARRGRARSATRSPSSA